MTVNADGADGDAPFARVSTGVSGLDEVLHGGLPERGTYLLRGATGTGKTTLGLQFLLAGIAQGDTCLFVSLAQSRYILERIARSHGWSLDGVHVHAITAHDSFREKTGRQDVFVTDEVEFVDIAERVRGAIEQVRPARLVFDSLSFMEILATAPGRFEHELASLVALLGQLQVTSLFIVNRHGADTAELITDGTIELEHLAENFAGLRYRLSVPKMRGSAIHGGNHDYEIAHGGLMVYPRLTLMTAPTFAATQEGRPLKSFQSEIAALDDLLGGGLGAGSSCLVRGPSGVGKTTLASTYVHAAAGRGERCVYFLFEEIRDTFLRRTAALSMDLSAYIEADVVRVPQIGGATVLPGELFSQVRDALDWGAEIVVIDSLSGYYQSLPDEQMLLAVIRNTVRFLSEHGITSILTLTHRPDPLEAGATAMDVLDIHESVDVMINLQYVVVEGELGKAISVVKRRDGDHQKAMRSLTIGEEGMQVGAKLPWYGVRSLVDTPGIRALGAEGGFDAATDS